MSAHPSRVGLWLRGDADCALLRLAASQAGLVVLEPASFPDEGAFLDHLASGVAMIIADNPLDERLRALAATASLSGSPPLLIVLADDQRKPGEGSPDQCVAGVLRLDRPLERESLSRQLGLLACAHRLSNERHASLSEEVHRYRRVFDSICSGITISDATQPGAPLVYVNPAFERMTGYAADEAEGRSCSFLQGTETGQASVSRIREAIREVREERALLRNFRKDGTPFWNELYLSPIFDLGGNLTHFVGLQNDVTAKIEAELQLLEERDRLHAAAECSMDCLYICEAVRDAGGTIVDFTFNYLNSNVAKMVSIPLASLLGGRMCELMPINRTLGLFELYKRVVLTGEPLVHEFSIEDKDVRSSWIRVQAVKLKDGIVITASDITLRKREEERTIYNAQHDSLTALPNRSVLKERVDQGLLWARRHVGLLGVFLIDLDGFKAINDTLGHAAGDETLVTVAGRLTNCMRAVDSVIRIGGDEFIVVMPELRQQSDACMLADRILDALRLPMKIAGQLVSVTSSIGIAIYPDSGRTTEELLCRSDAAMYSAKRRGKNQYELFLPQSEAAEVQCVKTSDDVLPIR